MATTSLVLEIVIMGAWAALWLSLLILRVSGASVGGLAAQAQLLKEWATPLILLLVAICYQLGSLVNTTGFVLIRALFGNKILAKNFPADVCKSHRFAEAKVLQSGSADLIKGVYSSIPYMRLSRAAFLNFMLLGSVVITFGGKLILLGLTFYLLSALSLMLSYRLEKIFWEEMRAGL